MTKKYTADELSAAVHTYFYGAKLRNVLQKYSDIHSRANADSELQESQRNAELNHPEPQSFLVNLEKDLMACIMAMQS